MSMNEVSASPLSGTLPLHAAADLQDHLMVASHDLERLQTLLEDACSSLMGSFYGATDEVRRLASDSAPVPVPGGSFDQLNQHLGVAVTALQFQDMASQLIHHTSKRLRSCVDRLAKETMGDDEEGAAIYEEPPLRPNPVTQDEMDAGSVELF
ncbi:MAG: hypothetical protein JWP52_2763 [Rhizobacter sp.]|nr:hypothetical protein [Rhizobacter sp.]